MNDKSNICKFVTNTGTNRIVTSNFILETDPQANITMSARNNNAIYIVISGEGKLHTQFEVNKIKTGNVFFSFAQNPFSIESTKGLNYMYISFTDGRSDELFRRFGINPKNCVFEGNEGLVAFWQNSIARAGEKNLDLISEAVLLYTIGIMTTPPHDERQLLADNILKCIEDNVTDNGFNLEVLSVKLGYNSKYISRFFKSEFGVTFSTYLTNLRIQHAVFLIEQGVTAIKNVAILSGYSDPFYFSKIFKQINGISPSDFIKKKYKNLTYKNEIKFSND